MHAPGSLVCARLVTCMRAHSLEGTLPMIPQVLIIIVIVIIIIVVVIVIIITITTNTATITS